MINSGFKPGFLEVYCGPMKSGKSKELLNRLDRIKYISGCKSLLVKPSLDTRDNGIKSRGGDYLFSQIINYDTPEEILNLMNGYNVLGIDEVQFFDKGLIKVLESLLKKEINILVSGLDTDFRGEPFGIMPYLMSLANSVTKLSAVCMYNNCGRDATRTQRLIDGIPAPYNAPIILIGDEKEGYEPRCLQHHICEK
ncbi:MAG: thymidine kinase [Parcubacteria group bacterium GW2011_GWF2_40_10]|nr:MAG: thymidine kinase [Parcubacteria group bacterium GW2011_GWF2_40_10]HIG95035.1 thymidine kinase [Nanoarchaeota archaeon]HIH62854.1 thymidine kinase [Nanoarchaeota archaeon]HIJ10271.1 thymidine kinase [Nanoarchaeota archaeon]